MLLQDLVSDRLQSLPEYDREIITTAFGSTSPIWVQGNCRDLEFRKKALESISYKIVVYNLTVKCLEIYELDRNPFITGRDKPHPNPCIEINPGIPSRILKHLGLSAWPRPFMQVSGRERDIGLKRTTTDRFGTNTQLFVRGIMSGKDLFQELTAIYRNGSLYQTKLVYSTHLGV